MPEKQHSTELTYQWLSLDELLQYRSQWHQLAQNSIDPNPLYEPDFLAASIRHLKIGKTFLLAIWADRQRQHMAGLFPLQKRWWRNGFVFPVTSLYFSDYTIITNPLIADADPSRIWLCALAAIAENPDLPSSFCTTRSYAGSQTAGGLAQTIASRNLSSRLLDSFNRPIVASDESYRDYTLGWSRKKRKNLGRATRNIHQAGKVTFDTVSCSDPDFEQVLDDFLKLEASGWKGDKGTALLSNANTLEFARQAFGSCGQSPTVHFDRLLLDGRMIACNANLVSQETVFCIKAAYDEEHARLSPGVLLDNYLLARTLDDKIYRQLDSCADANHYLASLWQQSQRVETILLNTLMDGSSLRLSLLQRGFDFFKYLKNKIKNHK